MALIVYLDETGDHTLELVDKDFPIFVIAMVVCDTTLYAQDIVPAFYQLKIDYFGHEAVILHSRDIRKRQGEFGFLIDQVKRESFLERVNTIMDSSEYTLIASAIRKQEHKDRYGIWAENPYDLAFKFSMERLLPLLENIGQRDVQLVAESRGQREDDELRLCLHRIVNSGTEYIESRRFRQIRFRLEFRPKGMNIIGTQMADLAGYPIARYVLDNTKPNPPYDIIQKKFYRGRGWVKGLKVFP